MGKKQTDQEILDKLQEEERDRKLELEKNRTRWQNEINDLARQYEAHRNPQDKARIWLLLSQLQPYLFHTDHIRKYLKMYPSTKYENGSEFVSEVFYDQVPPMIDEYRYEFVRDGKTVHCSFMTFFFNVFPRRIVEALRNLARLEPYDFVVTKANPTLVYETASESSVITGLRIKQNKKKRVVSKGAGWYRIETKVHGRLVYVREQDVEYHEVTGFEPLDEDSTIPAPPIDWDLFDDRTDSPVDTYMLVLLTLWREMEEKKTEEEDSLPSRRDCFRYFYTEVLIKELKKIYPVAVKHDGLTFSRARETEMVELMDRDLIDYILRGAEPRFQSLATRPRHRYCDHGCGCSVRLKWLYLPLGNAQYYDFLTEHMSIPIENRDVFEASMTEHWTEFYNTYARLANKTYKESLKPRKSFDWNRAKAPKHDSGCKF